MGSSDRADLEGARALFGHGRAPALILHAFPAVHRRRERKNQQDLLIDLFSLLFFTQARIRCKF